MPRPERLGSKAGRGEAGPTPSGSCHSKRSRARATNAFTSRTAKKRPGQSDTPPPKGIKCCRARVRPASPTNRSSLNTWGSAKTLASLCTRGGKSAARSPARKNTEFSVDGNVRFKPFLPSTWRITIEPEVSRRDSSTQLSRTSSSSSCGKHSASLEFDFVCTLLISSVTA